MGGVDDQVGPPPPRFRSQGAYGERTVFRACRPIWKCAGRVGPSRTPDGVTSAMNCAHTLIARPGHEAPVPPSPRERPEDARALCRQPARPAHRTDDPLPFLRPAARRLSSSAAASSSITLTS